MPVMLLGSEARSMTISRVKIEQAHGLLNACKAQPRQILLCRRLAGEDAPAEARPVLIVLDVTRRADEIGERVVRGFALQPRGFAAVLHLLDGLEQRFAHPDDHD